MLTTLAACGGGAVANRVTPPVAQVANSGTAASTAAVDVSIAIPVQASSSTRQPAYVSTSTKSVGIAVGGSMNVIDCSTECSGAIVAPVGMQTFVASLYDGKNASGNVLATGRTSANVINGQRNSIKMTFGGVVASVNVSLTPSTVSAGAKTSAVVSVVAKDAAGRTIVGSDAYASPILLTDDDTSGATVLSRSDVPDPSTSVTLSYNGTATLTTAHIGASVANSVIKVQSGTFTVSAAPSGSSPTPVPSNVPATPAPGSGGCTYSNGVEWTSGCRPFAANSIWNTKITNYDNPLIYGDSATIMANTQSGFHNSVLGSIGSVDAAVHTDTYGNADATGHAVVFATGGANDVQVHVRCRTYCNGYPYTDSVGAYGINAQGVGTPDVMWIPKKARPSSGSDHHLAVIQPDGTEIDMFGTVQLSNGVSLYWQPATGQTSDPEHDWTSSDIVYYGGGQTMGNFFTGPGQTNSTIANAATAGGGALAAGQVTQAELASGVIPHALFILSGCVSPNVHVFPATQNGDNSCAGTGLQVPYGAHLWVSLTDAQINALPNVSADQKTVLHAMHQYGGYVEDAGGNRSLQYTDGFWFHFEGGASFNPFGADFPFDTYAASQGSANGWYSQNIQKTEYYWVDNSGLDWSNIIKIVDPCYAQQTC